MRVLRVLGIFVTCGLVGTVGGVFVGAFLLAPNPGGRAPGDGLLILFCMGLGFVLALPVSTLLAVWDWYRSGRRPKAFLKMDTTSSSRPGLGQ
jgi:hypothetical protein